MFFYTLNLAQLSCKSDVLPWNYVAAGPIPDEVRKRKDKRQIWYKSPSTEHYFYTGIEGSNPGMRVSKDNPPRAIHAFAADYDIKIPIERANEAMLSMREGLRPAYIERSLGGNLRLVWLLPRSLPVDTYEFCAFILEKAVGWLNLGLLPGLDEPAFTTPTRLYCNGCEWVPTGYGCVRDTELQSFFVAAAKEFRFAGSDGPDIPLDIVEAELKKLYPQFAWPSDFTPETSGPTFWIPESTSPTSAILKPEGFITFAAHALKPFYSWADLLGAEFIRQYSVKNIAKATTDIYYDGKKFWRINGATYRSLEMPELLNHFKVECKLTNKSDKSGSSQIETALNHIYNTNRVDGVAPFVWRPQGPLEFSGRRILNNYVNRVVQPATGTQRWPEDFPFLAAMLDNLFDSPVQLAHFLAWLRYAYLCALNNTPHPGQNVFIMGHANVGKTLLNREIVGYLLGGYADASEFLIRGGAFNSELFEAPVWSIDDETATESETTRTNFSAMIKKCTANNTHTYKKKFEVNSMTEWAGRILITTNLDYVSSRILGTLDNTSKDKTSLFRCSDNLFNFPPRGVIVPTIRTELPNFARWLLDSTPPAFVIPDSRFGYQSYQEPTLLEKSQQGGRSASFKELLSESLAQWFGDNPAQTEWRGSVTAVIRLVYGANPYNDVILRSMKLEGTAKYLETIQREGVLRCETETGSLKQRVWIFYRP